RWSKFSSSLLALFYKKLLQDRKPFFFPFFSLLSFFLNMPSTKRASKNTMALHSNHGSVHDDDEVIPKAEFMPHSVDSEEAEAYWVAMTAPPAESLTCRARGYFTCYEAHLLRCYLWFPIPEVIIQTLNRFELSISQMTLTGLQNIISISGMTLDADYFKALLRPLSSSGPLMHRLNPRQYMSIIKKKISSGHEWRNCFFFVRINDASFEESCIPIFRSEWSPHVPNPLWPFPEDLIVVRDLLWGGPFHWTSFSLKRVRKALAYHSSSSDVCRGRN
ncbi:hypothetical protein IGI04_035614, partial [Brassica rapa subsp. trilocularis]